MILLVNDANILIDLLKIGLLESFFQLECEFHVTDFVVVEVQEDNVAELNMFIENGSLHKKSFDFEELMQVQLLEVKHQALSIADCSCLFHARKLSAQLLTGDAALRRTAQQEQLSVHGILWIFDELVRQNLLPKEQAIDKLSELMLKNTRLPATECKKRFKRWK